MGLKTKPWNISKFGTFQKKYKLTIIAIGLGEKEDDLQIFDAEKFAEAFTQTS